MKDKTASLAVELVILVQRICELDIEVLEEIRKAHAAGDCDTAQHIAEGHAFMMAGLSGHMSILAPVSALIRSMVEIPGQGVMVLHVGLRTPCLHENLCSLVAF